MMTNSEFIEYLKTLPQDAEIECLTAGKLDDEEDYIPRKIPIDYCGCLNVELNTVKNTIFIGSEW